MIGNTAQFLVGSERLRYATKSESVGAIYVGMVVIALSFRFLPIHRASGVFPAIWWYFIIYSTLQNGTIDKWLEMARLQRLLIEVAGKSR